MDYNNNNNLNNEHLDRKVNIDLRADLYSNQHVSNFNNLRGQQP